MLEPACDLPAIHVTSRMSASNKQPLLDCEHCRPLRRDTNVLVLARLSELRGISAANFVLALFSAQFNAAPSRDHGWPARSLSPYSC